jgi:hypothetical protein
VVLQEIIDEHLIMLIIQESFYVLEHFQEDHLIIEVEMMDKNQIPKKKFHSNK